MKLTKIVSASIDIELWNKFCSVIDIAKQSKGRNKRKVTKSSVYEGAIVKFINKNKPKND